MFRVAIACVRRIEVMTVGEDTSTNEAMSKQKMKQGKKTFIYAKRLKHVRKQLGDEKGVGNLSQAKFARILDVHPSAISHVEAGDTRIQPDLAKVIEEKTGFRQAWLLTGESPERIEAPPPPKEWRAASDLSDLFSYVRKVKSLLSAGSGELVYDEQTEGIYAFRTEWLAQKGFSPSYLRFAQVSGDSMLPTLEDGDFVLFDTSKCTPLDGKIMIVGIDNYLYIKRVRVSPDGTFLVSDNKEVYGPWRVNDESTRYLGLVVWHCGDV